MTLAVAAAVRAPPTAGGAGASRDAASRRPCPAPAVKAAESEGEGRQRRGGERAGSKPVSGMAASVQLAGYRPVGELSEKGERRGARSAWAAALSPQEASASPRSSPSPHTCKTVQQFAMLLARLYRAAQARRQPALAALQRGAATASPEALPASSSGSGSSASSPSEGRASAAATPPPPPANALLQSIIRSDLAAEVCGAVLL